MPAAAPDRVHHGPPAIDPTAPAGTASRVLLSHLAAAAQQHADEILRGDRPEAIHDLRVALRRARCLLGPLRPVFARAGSERLRAGLRWLGELTGPTRDQEVLLERIAVTGDALPDEDRPALDRLAARVRRERDQAMRALEQGLRSPRYVRLVETWRAMSSPGADRPPRASRAPRPGAAPAPSPFHAQPISAVAAAAIDRAWRRLLRDGRALDDRSAPEAFHRVRIDGKKLRYLIELFRSAYPGVDLEPIVGDLKRLQDGLGKLNDAQVQGEWLRATAKRLTAETSTDGARSTDATGADATGADVTDADVTGTLLMIGRMIERSRRAATAGRRVCLGRLDALDTRENRRLIGSLAAG